MNRYFKLDTAWDTRPWIQALSSEAQNVWIKLQCYIAAHGVGGRANALTPAYAARIWWVGEESVKQCLTAAQIHHKLGIDEDSWILLDWKQDQGESEERKAYKREWDRAHAETRHVTGSKRDQNPTNPTQNPTNPTHKKREEEEEIRKELPPKSPKGGPALPASLESLRDVVEEFISHRKHMGRSKALTPEALRRQCLRFERWGVDVARKQIEECIERGWMAPIDPEPEKQDDLERIKANLRAEGYE